jgi:hypothetical protein
MASTTMAPKKIKDTYATFRLNTSWYARLPSVDEPPDAVVEAAREGATGEAAKTGEENAARPRAASGKTREVKVEGKRNIGIGVGLMNVAPRAAYPRPVVPRACAARGRAGGGGAAAARRRRGARARAAGRHRGERSSLLASLRPALHHTLYVCICFAATLALLYLSPLPPHLRNPHFPPPFSALSVQPTWRTPAHLRRARSPRSSPCLCKTCFSKWYVAFVC